MNRRDRLFYLHWILANAVSEGIGLSVTLLTAVLASRMVWPEPTRAAIVLGALFIVIVGSLFEGALVGYAQAQVLAPRLPRLRRQRWTWATALGAGIAWVLGLLPAAVGDLLDHGALAEEPSSGSMLLGAALSGAFLGAVLAFPQWHVLRHLVKGAWPWLPANAVAWSIGMTIVFAGMDRLAWTGGIAGVADGVFFVCAMAGAAVGAVHGWVLLRLLSNPAADGDAMNQEASPATGTALPP